MADGVDTSYVYSKETGMWTEFDDERVLEDRFLGDIKVVFV